LEAILDPRVEVRLNAASSGYRTVPSDWRFVGRVIDDHLLYLITAGGCDGRVGGRLVSLDVGGLLWLPPRTPHDFWLRRAQPPVTLYHVRFRLMRTGRDLALAEPVQISDAWSLQPILRELVEELQVALPFKDARLRTLLAELSIGAFRSRAQPILTNQALTRLQQRRLFAHLARLSPLSPTPAELAAELGLSLDYFSRRFRATFGLAPRSWLTRERIRRAALELSESTATVSEVAYNLGYRDLGLFSRQFKRVIGVAPSEFRRRR
jgi:AraC-like DNA-binding protein